MSYQINNEEFEYYNFLMDSYIETIIKLIDFSIEMRILPFKIWISINYIKNYIIENRIEILENGITYLLTNKEIILNFDISNLDDLDELDDDSNDNLSRKECINTIKKKNKFENLKEIELLNIIIEIKNNSKKISTNNIILIKNYFELLIDILQKIKNIF